MTNTAQFWKMVREKQAALKEEHPSGCLFLTSLENPEKNSTAGNIAEVSVANAGRWLVMGTHRESTPAEIEAHKQREAANVQAAQAAERLARRTFNDVDPATTAASVLVAMRMLRDEEAKERPGKQQPQPQAKGN